MIETKRVANGQFEVYKDGIKTHLEIFNGDLGCSGNGRNTYGIRNNETKTIAWVGSLARCKKTAAHWLK